MSPLLLLTGLAFSGATTLSILYAHQWLTAPQRVARRRIAPRTNAGLASLSPLLGGRRSPIPLADRLPLSAEARARMESELEIAGVRLRVSEYVALRTFVAFVSAGGGAAAIASAGAPSWLLIASVVALTFVGWQLPRFWVARQHNIRLDAIERQLPTALTTLSKSLRAGTGLLQAIDFASSQVGAPLGPEFATTLRQIRLGADPEEAFTALSRRVGSPDLDIAVTAIVIQRNVGGNLSEILTNVSSTITEREKISREVKVLTSRQKLTGNLVALIPVLVALAFIAINPDIGHLLLRTTPGQISLAIGLAFEIVGIFLIRKLARIEV